LAEIRAGRQLRSTRNNPPPVKQAPKAPTHTDFLAQIRSGSVKLKPVSKPATSDKPAAGGVDVASILNARLTAMRRGIEGEESDSESSDW
jgi:hypothetical protein